MKRTAIVSIAVLTTWIAGCSNVSTSTAAASATATAPGDGPCALLPDAVVQGVFPGAKPGQPDRRNEKYGVFTCLWDLPRGHISIIEGGEEESVEAEARGWTHAFIDPLDQGAARHVRYETLPGIGDGAMAVVERIDKAKGFISGAAYLVVRRRSRQIVLMAPALAWGERADALKVLEQLGRAVASRL